MSLFKEKLKRYYEIDEAAFEARTRQPSFFDLPNIDGFPSVEKAISELEKCKENGEKILVYGDYDFDGVASTSIIYECLKRKSFHVSFYIPSRYLDGYGLNVNNVNRIAKAGFSMIFCVDNGVSSIEAIQRANELGIKVIVLDHHEYKEEPPSIVSLIHPKTVGLTSPSVSAGFLSYLFSKAYTKKDDPYFLTLGATSLLSDALPLLQYNRDAVNLALSLLNQYHFSSFKLLTEKQHFFASTLQMEIIPKINAIGRVEVGTETNRLVRYFVSEDENEKIKLANYFSTVNERRKQLTKNAETNIKIEENKASIFLITDLLEGLNGLLANRLLSEYEKPVAVFSPSKKDPSVYVGSIRSKEGFSVLKSLEGAHLNFIASGGHEFAGGVSIHKEDLEIFEKDFEFAALKHRFMKTEKKTIPIEENDCTIENLKLLLSFGPFGNGNPAPLFTLEEPNSCLSFTKTGGFLSKKINDITRLFSFVIKKENIPQNETLSFLCSMEPNEWKGNVSIRLLATEVETTDEHLQRTSKGRII